MVDSDDVPEASDDEPFNLARATIVIQKNNSKMTPKEFTRKTNNNKIWITLIVLLLFVIIALAMVLLNKLL